MNGFIQKLVKVLLWNIINLWTLRPERMGDHGKINDTTKFNYEGEQIYAFKPQSERFLCFFISEAKIIMTNGFRKKQQKIPPLEKERALHFKASYEQRIKKEDYYA